MKIQSRPRTLKGGARKTEVEFETEGRRQFKSCRERIPLIPPGVPSKFVIVRFLFCPGLFPIHRLYFIWLLGLVNGFVWSSCTSIQPSLPNVSQLFLVRSNSTPYWWLCSPFLFHGGPIGQEVVRW